MESLHVSRKREDWSFMTMKQASVVSHTLENGWNLHRASSFVSSNPVWSAAATNYSHTHQRWRKHHRQPHSIGPLGHAPRTPGYARVIPPGRPSPCRSCSALSSFFLHHAGAALPGARSHAPSGASASLMLSYSPTSSSTIPHVTFAMPTNRTQLSKRKKASIG